MLDRLLGQGKLKNNNQSVDNANIHGSNNLSAQGKYSIHKKKEDLYSEYSDKNKEDLYNEYSDGGNKQQNQENSRSKYPTNINMC